MLVPPPSAAARTTGEPASGGHWLHHRGRFVLMIRVASIGAWPRTRLAPITRPVRRVRHDPTTNATTSPACSCSRSGASPSPPWHGVSGSTSPDHKTAAGGWCLPRRARRLRSRLAARWLLDARAALRSRRRALLLIRTMSRSDPGRGRCPRPTSSLTQGYISGAERQRLASPQRADRRGGVGVGSGHRWTNNARRMTTRRRAARVSRKGPGCPWGGPSGTPLSVPADQKLNGDPTTKSSPLKNSTYMMP